MDQLAQEAASPDAVESVRESFLSQIVDTFAGSPEWAYLTILVLAVCTVFIVVRVIQHRERMAMIAKGLDPNRRDSGSYEPEARATRHVEGE